MRILLRTLTKKSIIQDGKNKGLTVGDVMQIRKSDLIYSYFHYANITYTEEILDELRIKPEDKIEKPGKSPDKYKYYIQRNLAIVSSLKISQAIKKAEEDGNQKVLPIGIVKKVTKNIVKAKIKSKMKGIIQREKIYFSKGAMQRRNHR